MELDLDSIENGIYSQWLDIPRMFCDLLDIFLEQ